MCKSIKPPPLFHPEYQNDFFSQLSKLPEVPFNDSAKSNSNSERIIFNDKNSISQNKEENYNHKNLFQEVSQPGIKPNSTSLLNKSEQNCLFSNQGIRNLNNLDAKNSSERGIPSIINPPQEKKYGFLSNSYQHKPMATGYNYSKQEKANKVIDRAKKISITDHYSQRIHGQDIDNNIISIGLDDLKEKSNIMSGERFCCKSCEASLNIYSKNIIKEANDQIWICEFCGNKNVIKFEEEEMPKSETITYLIQSIQQNINLKKEEQDISIIFCIDISGSMGVSQVISGKYKLKYDKNESLKEFNSFGDGSYQWLNSENRNSTYITRIQCVQIAIESQIISMAKAYPNRKI